MDYVLFTVGFGLFVLLISNLLLFQQPLWDSTFAPDMTGLGFRPENDADEQESRYDPFAEEDEGFFTAEDLEPYMIPANDDMPRRSESV